MWNFQDFTVTKILREINFGGSRSSKNVVFAPLGALNFVKLVKINLQGVQKSMKFKIQFLLMCWNGRFWASRFAYFDFTWNLSDRKILYFPQCATLPWQSNTYLYLSSESYLHQSIYIVVYYFFLKLQVISVALCSFPIAFDFWVIICIRYHEYNYTKQQKVTHREFVTRSCWVTLMPDGLLFIQIKTELHFQEKNQLTIFLQIDGNFVMG